MRLSECEQFFDFWQESSSKVFSLVAEFVPTDYLCIRKEKNYMVIEQNTSRTLTEIDRDKFIELMTKEVLRYEPNHSAYSSMLYLKTGGCSCGSFILGPESHHDSICDLVKNRGWRS